MPATLRQKREVHQVKEYIHDRGANGAHEAHLLAETQFPDSVGLSEIY